LLGTWVVSGVFTDAWVCQVIDHMDSKISSGGPSRKVTRCDALCFAACEMKFSVPFPGKRCFVGNLAWKTSWQDLKDKFREIGTVSFSVV
jgi:hypothetical protein